MGYEKTTGVVESLYSEPSESGNIEMARIIYTRHRDSNTWRAAYRLPLDELPSGCKVGDSLTMFFDPSRKNEWSDPDQKRAWLASRLWRDSMIGFGFGGVLIAIGVLAPRRHLLTTSDSGSGSSHEGAI